MKYSGMLLAVCCCGALAQVQHGTTVVINRANDEIMIAADSRGLSLEGTVDDSQCKITPLGRYMIFAAAGIADYTPSFADSWSSWRSSDEGRAAYKALISREGDPGFAELVAKEWTRRIVLRWSLLARTMPDFVAKFARAHNGELVSSFFGGTDSGGRELTALFVDVSYDPHRFPVIVATEPAEHANNFWTLGFAEVVTAFRGESERAKSNENIVSISRYVQIEIDMHIPEGAISEVGGAVDALELPRGRPIRWFRRKNNCPGH